MNDATDIGASSLERLDVICTGGLYDDPELGPTPRHTRQKLRRIHVRRRTRQGTVAPLFQREPPLRCPQCGRTVTIAGTGVIENSPEGHPETGMRYEGGVWLRVAGHAARTSPDRRVVTVDISDPCYPW
jgi:hypothetical protein